MDPDNQRPRRKRVRRRALAIFALTALALLSAGETINGPLQRDVASRASGTSQPTSRLDAIVAPAPLPPQSSPPPPPAPRPVARTAVLVPHLTVPILLYHYIRVNPNPRDTLGYGLSVTPSAFAQQMALLHADGATTITLATLMDAMAGRRTLPAHPVVLTFDDGYADFATTAEPVLPQYGFVATDYVVSGFIGRPNYMTADQVRAMDAAGMVIGSHTVHHVNLPAMSPVVAKAEIDGGQSALAGLLGHPVLDFAYPYGGVTALDVQLVQRAGFREAVTTAAGDVQAFTACYLLHRDHIGGSTTLAQFAWAAGLPPPIGGGGGGGPAGAPPSATGGPAQPPADVPAPRASPHQGTGRARPTRVG